MNFKKDKKEENGKQPNFGPDFGLVTPNLEPQKFFLNFTSTSC